MKYKFFVHDDGYKIADAEFSRFCDAFDYAQGGLLVCIDAVPCDEFGKYDEENSKVAWTWDDIYNREEAIENIAKRFPDYCCEDCIEEQVDDGKFSKADLENTKDFDVFKDKLFDDDPDYVEPTVMGTKRELSQEEIEKLKADVKNAKDFDVFTDDIFDEALSVDMVGEEEEEIEEKPQSKENEKLHKYAHAFDLVGTDESLKLKEDFTVVAKIIPDISDMPYEEFPEINNGEYLVQDLEEVEPCCQMFNEIPDCCGEICNPVKVDCDGFEKPAEEISKCRVCPHCGKELCECDENCHCNNLKENKDFSLVQQAIPCEQELEGGDCAVEKDKDQPLVAHDEDTIKDLKKLKESKEEEIPEGANKIDYVEYKHSYAHALEPKLKMIQMKVGAEKKPAAYIKAIVKNTLQDPSVRWTDKEHEFFDKVMEMDSPQSIYYYIKNAINKAHEIFVYVDKDGELVESLNEAIKIPGGIQYELDDYDEEGNLKKDLVIREEEPEVEEPKEEEPFEPGEDQLKFDFDEQKELEEEVKPQVRDYIKDNAKKDFEVGQTFSIDDFGQFKKLAKEDGYDVEKDDFDYYFDCLDELRSKEVMNEELEDDMSDEEFVEAFGKALKEKHDQEELKEEAELDEANIFSKIKDKFVNTTSKLGSPNIKDVFSKFIININFNDGKNDNSKSFNDYKSATAEALKWSKANGVKNVGVFGIGVKEEYKSSGPASVTASADTDGRVLISGFKAGKRVLDKENDITYTAKLTKQKVDPSKENFGQGPREEPKEQNKEQSVEKQEEPKVVKDKYTLVGDENQKLKTSSDLKGLEKLQKVVNDNDDAKIVDKVGKEIKVEALEESIADPLYRIDDDLETFKEDKEYCRELAAEKGEEKLAKYDAYGPKFKFEVGEEVAVKDYPIGGWTNYSSKVGKIVDRYLDPEESNYCHLYNENDYEHLSPTQKHIGEYYAIEYTYPDSLKKPVAKRKYITEYIVADPLLIRSMKEGPLTTLDDITNSWENPKSEEYFEEDPFNMEWEDYPVEKEDI